MAAILYSTNSLIRLGHILGLVLPEYHRFLLYVSALVVTAVINGHLGVAEAVVLVGKTIFLLRPDKVILS
jgi:hypothetical protein